VATTTAIRTLHEGKGWSKPERRSQVTVHIVGSCAGAVFQDTRQDASPPQAHKLGGATLNRGLEAAIRSMKKGERSIFAVGSEAAFGVHGLTPHVPPGADVEYDVELVDFTPVEDLSKVTDTHTRRRAFPLVSSTDDGASLCAAVAGGQRQYPQEAIPRGRRMAQTRARVACVRHHHRPGHV